MKKSFTLIELLIVIAIIAIIAVGIIILIIPGERLAQARDATRAAHLKNLETALYLYDLDHGLATLGITENLTEICNTELENYDCEGLVNLSTLGITIPTDPLGGNSPNGTGYYLALINNKAVLYATKAETKETKIGVAEGVTFIYTWEDLHNIRDDLTGHYILMNNLNSATDGYSDYNTGAGWEPIGTAWINPFIGKFDGQNYIINGLYINRAETDNLGLFAFSQGNIVNCILTGVDITGKDYIGGLVGVNIGTINNSYLIVNILGNNYIGGFAGYSEGIIENSYSIVNLSGDNTVGGLVGINSAGIISKSYSKGNLIGTGGDTGGLVGNHGGTIINSYSEADVLGNINTGGLVGMSIFSTIINSYSMGEVNGNISVGGLVGYDDSGFGTFTNSFWDINTSGQVSSDGGIGKTTTEMQDIDTFQTATWDIIEIQNHNDEDWYINNNTDYPRLGWQ